MLKKEKFFGAVTVGERGQIVIPASAREMLGIKPGDKLLVIGHGHRGLMIVDGEALAGYVSRAMEHLSELEKAMDQGVAEQEEGVEVDGEGRSRS